MQQGLYGMVAHLWAPFFFCSLLRSVGDRPRLQGLCSQPVHVWATCTSTPRFEAVGIPEAAEGSVATWSTCGPLRILPPALKRWEPPMQQGLYGPLAHFWAPSDSAPCSEAVGTPRGGRGYVSQPVHVWATCTSTPRFEAVGIPQAAEGSLATSSTCGPLRILPPALKRWEPPLQQGLYGPVAHLSAPSNCAPCSKAAGTPRGCRGYVASRPTCGPLVILCLALKRSGYPKR